MSFVITSNDFVNCLEITAKKIAENKDYISELDGTTGDGDHWANLNAGYEAVLASSDHLRTRKIPELLREVGMIMMSKTGGSSGILYGSAFLAASAAVAGKDIIDSSDLCACLNAMSEAMCSRGNAKPGYKTMIDALYPAAETYENAAKSGMDDRECIESVREASTQGAEATAAMSAQRGRASYREDRGVGHLDPGAVTMSYLIESLCGYILENLL